MEEVLKNEKKPKYKTLKVCNAIAVACVCCGALQAATQHFAAIVKYNSLLKVDEIAEHFYTPWAILNWWGRFGEQQPELFKQPAQTGMLIFVVGMVVVICITVGVKSKLRGLETLHGSAHWATDEEVERCGLLHKKEDDSKPYVYVGAYVDKHRKVHYLKHSGPEHVLCYAPTRSGKGVGLVIPTLLSWNESAVITDLKGELWALTAGYRKQEMKQKTIRYEPASDTSACWNPLLEIRVGTENEVGDAQNLANMIVDPDGKGLDGPDGHWKKTAFALYTGLILYVLDLKAQGKIQEASLRVIDDMLAGKDISIEARKNLKKGDPEPKKSFNEYMEDMAKSANPVVSSAAQDQLDRPQDEGGSVLSTVKSNLSLFRDPIVARNSATSDFKIRDIMNSNMAVSAYVVTQPNDKTRLKPLVRIFVNMCVRLLADRMKFEGGRAKSCNHHRLLMMLDEFPSLGKLEIMQESLAFVAGYGIKCYLITQDLSQLKSRENGYGSEESITSNCHIQNAYPPNRMETAEFLSKMSGQTTVVKKSITKSGTSLFNTSTSTTMQEVQRPLLTPDECMRLPGPKKNSKGDIEEAGDMLVFVSGFPAIYGKQPLYFKDPVFLARSKIKAPDKTDVINPEDRYIDPNEQGQTQVVTSSPKETTDTNTNTNTKKDAVNATHSEESQKYINNPF